MCNVIPNRRMAFAVLLSFLSGCGIKYATNKVLSNPDAIAKVGLVYDRLSPRDTTERLVFIEGDSIVVEKSDTIVIKDTLMGDSSTLHTNIIYVTKQIRVSKTDTIKWQLPPDNRAMARMLDSLGKYTNELNQAKGNIAAKDEALKTANNRLLWMGGIILVLGIVIGLLIKFKVKS